jgi:hypothetical protein
MKKGSQQVFYSKDVICHKKSTFLSIRTMLEAPLKKVDNDELLLDLALFKIHTWSSKYTSLILVPSLENPMSIMSLPSTHIPPLI